MAGNEFTGGYGGVNVPGKFGVGRGNVGGGTGMIPFNPQSIRDPFKFDGRPMTPEQAQAAIANALANPIAPVPYTIQGPRYRNGYHIEDVRIDDQREQKPEDPGRRYATASTWGRTIPVSLGRRRIEGNLLQSTALIPQLEGTTEYEVEYEIPIYEDPPLKPGGSVTVTYPDDDRPRPDPDAEPEGCDPGAASPCDTRAPPEGEAPIETTFEMILTVTDPNPDEGLPFTVNIITDTLPGNIGVISVGCADLTVCDEHYALVGEGPWSLGYTITSTNSPPPTVELNFEVVVLGGGNDSVSGVGNPHSGTINVDSAGNVSIT